MMRLGRFGDALGVLGLPQLLVLLAAEALVVVAFCFEELLEVGLAVELSCKGGIRAQAVDTHTHTHTHTHTLDSTGTPVAAVV